MTGALRTHALTLAVIATAVLLGGCGGHDANSRGAASQGPSSSSVTPSPTSRALQNPYGSKTFAPPTESPNHFIQRWLRIQVQMADTGHTDPYRMITAFCSACSELAAQVDDLYADGGSVRGGAASVLAITRLGTHQGLESFRVDVQYASTRFKASSQAQVQVLAPGSRTYDVKLRSLPGGWDLVDFATDTGTT